VAFLPTKKLTAAQTKALQRASAEEQVQRSAHLTFLLDFILVIGVEVNVLEPRWLASVRLASVSHGVVSGVVWMLCVRHEM